jgi:hypothetical protein
MGCDVAIKRASCAAESSANTLDGAASGLVKAECHRERVIDRFRRVRTQGRQGLQFDCIALLPPLL